ncbi:MAG: metallophosphoesterase [Gemmatimonadota bacterium]
MSQMAHPNPSARGARTWHWRRATPVIAALVLLHPFPLASQPRVEGEYGLRVSRSGGDLAVGWLTPSPARGVLEVVAAGRTIHRVETPVDFSHLATIPIPSSEDIVLHYGASTEAPLHITTIRLQEEGPPAAVLKGVDSLFVVGDVHGEYDRLIALLGNAGLVDRGGRWTGGRSHVVFLGDIFDRGSDVTRTLWFLYGLEREAETAGGGAHVVLGNHETMIFTHDLRYVTEKELLLASLHGVPYPELFDTRESVLGRWLADRPAVMWVDGVLLAHGGVAPSVLETSVEMLNDSIRAFLHDEIFYRWADSTVAVVTDRAAVPFLRDQYDEVIVTDSAALARRYELVFQEESVLWYRGYVNQDTLGPALDAVLERFDAHLHVVGHTPLPSIEGRYEGRLVAVDLLEPATELLLLVRDASGGRHRSWRIGVEGPPEPL